MPLLRALRLCHHTFATLDSSQVRRRILVDLTILAALGIALIALTFWMAHWADLTVHARSYAITLGAQIAVYALAAWWVMLRRPNARGALLIIVLVALATRIAFVPQAPTASNDLYRYIWDGRIQAQGINPYRYPPADPALASYRDPDIYPNINRKPVPTIYPPVAQAILRGIYAIYPDSVAWTRLALAGFDLVTILVIAGLLVRLGLRPERVILYAWHPLLILELGHSGHLDVVVITFLALALWARLADRPILTGLLLACATLTKFYAIVALPALLWPGLLHSWRQNLRFVLAAAISAMLAYLPFLSVGFGVFGYLGGYVQEEGIASGDRFYLLRHAQQLAVAVSFAPPRWLAGFPITAAQGYQALVVAALGAIGLWCWLRPRRTDREIVGRVLILFLTLIVLTSPSYPWYTLLVLPYIPLVGWRLLVPASALVGAAGFLYLQWWWPGQPLLPMNLGYSVPLLALAVVAVTVAAQALVGRLRRPTSPSPPRPLRRLLIGSGFSRSWRE